MIIFKNLHTVSWFRNVELLTFHKEDNQRTFLFYYVHTIGCSFKNAYLTVVRIWVLCITNFAIEPKVSN